MKFLLDTDHISFLQRRAGAEYSAIAARMSQYAATDFASSVVSFHEQVLGAHALLNRARTLGDVIHGYAVLSEVAQSYATRRVLDFDAAAAAVLANLQGQRIRIATMDLRIASIALSQKLILSTRTVRDFGRVPGLVTEDWTA